MPPIDFPNSPSPGDQHTAAGTSWEYDGTRWRVVRSAAGDRHHVHNEGTPSAVWTVDHNLSKRPSVTVVDSAGSVQITEVEYVNNNTCIVRCAAAFSGQAYCN